MELITNATDLRRRLDELVTDGTALGFDVGNVLDPFTGDVPRRMFQEKSGMTYEQVRHFMNISPTTSRFFRGLCSIKEFAQGLLDDLKIDAPHDWVVETQLQGHGPIDHMTHGVARALRARAACTFILSNNSELHVGFIQKTRPQILEPFDFVWFSHEIHLWKPDADCLDYVEQHLPAGMREIVFVDDSLENLEAMQARGWRVIHYNNNPHAR